MRCSKEILEKANDISNIMSSLSSPTRLLIACMLIDGEKNVTEILDRIGTTKGNISQHLKLLTSNGILKKRRDANKIYYSISDERIIKLISTIKDLYCPDFKF